MNNLVELKGDDIFTTSLIIAEYAKVKHHAIQQMISKHESSLKRFGIIAFEMRKLSGAGRPEIIYHLNEEQATLLITFLKNTEPVIQFKIELVRQFYAMRRLLMERQTQTWQETRYQGKLTRKVETDVLKQLVDYAKDQGSQNADKLYMTYSKLANKMTGIASRDTASVMQLNNLSVVENIILHCVQLGILGDKHYKQIYQDCKQRLIDYQEIAFLEPGKETLPTINQRRSISCQSN